MIGRPLAEAAIATVASAAAHRAGALSRDGALAAWAVGFAVMRGSSWRGVTLLGTFFVSSSALTRLPGIRDNQMADAGHRNARQVVANGGVSACAALAGLVSGSSRSFAVLAGSLAAAAADTWATEVGATSSRPPRLLVSRRQTTPGTNGGVTARGLGASLAAASLLGGIAALIAERANARLGVAVTIAGFGGSLLDSVLGELVQERRYCVVCQQSTEQRVHRCGSRTQLKGGVCGVDNDVVNLLATVAGGLIAGGLAKNAPLQKRAPGGYVDGFC